MSERTMELNKAIVEAGVKHGAWSWTDGIVVNDVTITEAADSLVDGAQQAGAKGSVNAAVLEILFAAGIEPTSAQTREAFAERFNVQISAPAATSADPPAAPGGAFAPTPADTSAMAQASAAPVESQSPAAGDSGLLDISHIFPGYDDMKVAQIKSAVLESAASGDLSVEEWELIKVYEAAHEERKTVLKLEPEFKAPEPPPAVESHSVGPNASGAFGSATQAGVTQMAGGGAPPDAGEGLGAFYNGETISRAQQEGLPVPPQTTGEGVVMPIDITSTSDQELSRLATSYHSLFARTQWLISQEEGRERAAEQLEHDAHRDAYVSAYENHKSEIPEGKAGPTALDAARKLAEKDADNAQPVHTWRTRRIRHGADARELKALSTGYDKAVWRINEELDRRARLATTATAAR